jgi:ABC-type bacteriocin/lantibiotic exporter with double-glycine peptidase domain
MLQVYKDTNIFSPVIKRIHVGMDSKLLNYSYAKQNRSNWCWAACIEMITKYYGLHIKQEFFAQNHCGIDANGWIKDCPAPVDVITSNLNWCHKTHCIKTQVFSGRPDEDSLVKLLNADIPVILAYRQRGPIGHAVVMTGITYEETMFGTEPTSLIVRDPAPYLNNIVLSGRKVYSSPKIFLNSVYAWWVPTVQKHNQQLAA